MPKGIEDPTAGLPEICISDGSLAERFPLGHDFKYLNLNVHMLEDLSKDRTAFQTFFRRMLEQFIFEQNLIEFEDAKFFHEKLA